MVARGVETVSLPPLNCRELARRERRGDEARPIRQHQPKPLPYKRSVRSDDEPVRAIRKVADYNSIETRPLMRLRKPLHVIDVDRRPAWRMNLRCGLRADHPINSTLMRASSLRD